MVGLAAVLAYLYPMADPFVDYQVAFDGTNDHLVKWTIATLGAQPSESSLATTQASAAYLTYSGAPAVVQRGRDADAAKVEIDHSAISRGLRGAAAVLVDEINLLRDWNTGLASAVATATSLADLKTRVALLPALADRTLAQAKTAIQNKISSGVVD